MGRFQFTSHVFKCLKTYIVMGNSTYSCYTFILTHVCSIWTWGLGLWEEAPLPLCKQLPHPLGKGIWSWVSFWTSSNTKNREDNCYLYSFSDLWWNSSWNLCCSFLVVAVEIHSCRRNYCMACGRGVAYINKEYGNYVLVNFVIELLTVDYLFNT